MNNIKTILITAAVAIFVTLLGISANFSFSTETAQGASYPMAPSFTVATTSTAVSVSGTSVRILATTTNPAGFPGVSTFTRAYASICNPSSTIVYLRLDGDKPVVTGQGTVMIGAAAGYNACYELIDEKMTYNGSITASSTAGTVSVSVTEYVY